jgi:G3E family GTPase
VTLLTGFLGAGKTTLLNRILNGEHGLRVGVLVNDFGAINIDAELIEGVEENTINLTNGCVCCEIRDDLVQSLEELLMRVDAIDYVILEASGVADPEGIVMTFVDQRYEQLLRLDSITCVIDAEAVFAHGDDEKLNMLKLRQIGFADLVVLNKVDLVGPEHLEVIKNSPCGGTVRPGKRSVRAPVPAPPDTLRHLELRVRPSFLARGTARNGS